MSTTKIESRVYVARPYSVARDNELKDPKYRSARFRDIRPKADGRKQIVVGEWPNHRIMSFQTF